MFGITSGCKNCIPNAERGVIGEAASGSARRPVATPLIQQSALDGPTGDLRTGGEVELLEDGRDVTFGGALGDAELKGDLGVGAASSNEPGNVALASREAAIFTFSGLQAGQTRRCGDLKLDLFLERRAQLLVGDVACQIVGYGTGGPKALLGIVTAL